MITLPWNGNFRPFSNPRSIVKVNGVIVPFRSWQVDQNGYSSADTFDLTLPFRVVDHLKGTTDLANSSDQESILLTQPDILVEIYAGYPSNPDRYNENDLTQLMYGYLDTVDFYFDEQGERVEIQGRNQVAPFMDTKTTDKFPNLTSSAIVITFAKQQGLSYQVTPTYTPAGSYYSDDHVTLTSDITQWDLMNFLADQEGFILRVKGNTLYFGPRDSFLKNTDLPYTWGQNVKTMKLSRSPHASKDIKVEVITWSSSKKSRIVTTSQSTTTHASRISGTSSHQQWVETYYIPGLTREQAQRRADAILDQLSKSELTGQITAQGNDAMSIDQPITIHGVGLGLSQRFWPTRISHSFDLQQGSYNLDFSFSNLNLPSDTGGI
jgi:hypothetical protein